MSAREGILACLAAILVVAGACVVRGDTGSTTAVCDEVCQAEGERAERKQREREAMIEAIVEERLERRVADPKQDPASLFTPIRDDEPVEDLVCGEGEHEIEIVPENPCDDENARVIERRKPRRRPDGTWAPPEETSLVEPLNRPSCEWPTRETWSDWPSCPGAYRIAHAFYDGCNWSHCDEGGGCVTTLLYCGGPAVRWVD